jgi:hypothetical protein
MPLISLEIYRHLFANEAAMAEFADTLERATREDDTPLVTFQDRHIATALSPRATERFLSAERPDTSSESDFGHAPALPPLTTISSEHSSRTDLSGTPPRKGQLDRPPNQEMRSPPS